MLWSLFVYLLSPQVKQRFSWTEMLASENGHWNQNCSCSCPKFAWYLVQFVVTRFSGSCITSTGLMFYFTFHSILLFLAMVVNKILYRSYIWSFAAIYRPCLHHYCKSVFQTTFGNSLCIEIYGFFWVGLNRLPRIKSRMPCLSSFCTPLSLMTSFIIFQLSSGYSALKIWEGSLGSWSNWCCSITEKMVLMGRSPIARLATGFSVSSWNVSSSVLDTQCPV